MRDGFTPDHPLKATSKAPAGRVRQATYRRRDATLTSSPLSVPAAAAALVQAVEDRFGLAYIEQIIINRTLVGAVYSDGSDQAFMAWRSEDDALRGRIPVTAPAPRRR